MSGFSNPVVGGQSTLIRDAIQSSNFNLANKTGWAIFKNGDAWFFNITATGAITGNVVVASGSGAGVFIYDGTPAKGSLVVAIVAQGGVDQYGNGYSGPGIAISAPGATGKNEIQIRPDKDAVLIYSKV